MKTHFDIEKLVENGSITNELDYERALIADRKLRLLSKDSTHFKNLRLKLRGILEEYENSEWSDIETITEEKLVESAKAERIAEFERLFIETRKQEIRNNSKN